MFVVASCFVLVQMFVAVAFAEIAVIATVVVFVAEGRVFAMAYRSQPLLAMFGTAAAFAEQVTALVVGLDYKGYLDS